MSMEKDPLRTRDDFKGKGVLRTCCHIRLCYVPAAISDLVLAFEFA